MGLTKITAENLQSTFEGYKLFMQSQVYVKKIWDNRNSCEQVLNLQRPPTILSFCLYADISREYYYQLLNGEVKTVDKQCVDIITRINAWITDYQITGAMLNELNPLIVSRLNGLNDTVNVQVTEQPVVNINLTALTGSTNKQLNENNIQDIEFTELGPIELSQNNTILTDHNSSELQMNVNE